MDLGGELLKLAAAKIVQTNLAKQASIQSISKSLRRALQRAKGKPPSVFDKMRKASRESQKMKGSYGGAATDLVTALGIEAIFLASMLGMVGATRGPELQDHFSRNG